MARLATTADVFNAIAEPQRRQILDLLARGEKSVGEVGTSMRARQPQISKHLIVLKRVGLVSVRAVGQQRLYKLNARGLKAIFDWVQPFEQFWRESYDRLDEYLQTLQTDISPTQTPSSEGPHDRPT